MKRYTVPEANALLGHLAPTLIELRDKSEKAARIKEDLSTAAGSNGGSAHREQWSKVLARVDELMQRIEDWGLVLRDLDTGLVDFPATLDGRDVYLCWKLGEVQVTHYHGPEDGFAGRREI